MKNEYQFTLDPGSIKYLCPACEKLRFVKYINRYSGEYLPDIYGRCDRMVKCKYHLNPYKDGFVNRIRQHGHCENPVNKRSPKVLLTHHKSYPSLFSEIPLKILIDSRNGYDQNNLIIWLIDLFDKETVIELIQTYYIGTSSHWPGSTIFWQIDFQHKIRTGKIMQYQIETGKRVKEPFNLIAWVHKVQNIKNFNLEQCYFGEHLLEQYQDKPVGIVESEKTAIIASVYFPQFVWLAVGSLTNLNIEKSKVLADRDVYLFPDLNGFEKWSIKANEFSRLIPSGRFYVDDFLEKNANKTDKDLGLDLADYLIRFDWRTFRKGKQEPFPISDSDSF